VGGLGAGGVVLDTLLGPEGSGAPWVAAPAVVVGGVGRGWLVALVGSGPAGS
jgi:hypothetical protein